MSEAVEQEPWQIIRGLLAANERTTLSEYVESLPSSEKVLALSRLEESEQQQIMQVLPTTAAADVLEALSSEQGADMVDGMSPDEAAPIIGEMISDAQADLLGSLEDSDSEAILAEMEPAEAEDARALLNYPENVAGGLMIREYLAYPETYTTGEMLNDIRAHDQYANYPVQYVYTLDTEGRLKGVLRIHDLLWTREDTPLKHLGIQNPVCLKDYDTLEVIRDVFERYDFIGIPVVDDDGKMLGLLQREDLQEELSREADQTFLSFSGIVGGEELRSLPLRRRCSRRLSWLSLNIILNVIAASVIAFHQSTIAALPLIAVFLPIISDMSGCSGNQSVAVSIRELAIGQLRPNEYLRVLGKESAVGLINGVMLGFFIGIVAILWKGNLWLGLIVGAALAGNTLFAVCFGGVVPLILRFFKVDPALASSPMLTTLTDVCGFIMILTMASLLMHHLV